jgi:hypothetical protein
MEIIGVSRNMAPGFGGPTRMIYVPARQPASRTVVTARLVSAALASTLRQKIQDG